MLVGRLLECVFAFIAEKHLTVWPTDEHVLEARNISVSHSTKQWRDSKNMHWLSRKNILHYLSSFERDFIPPSFWVEIEKTMTNRQKKTFQPDFLPNLSLKLNYERVDLIWPNNHCDWFKNNPNNY